MRPHLLYLIVVVYYICSLVNGGSQQLQYVSITPDVNTVLSPPIPDDFLSISLEYANFYNPNLTLILSSLTLFSTPHTAGPLLVIGQTSTDISVYNPLHTARIQYPLNSKPLWFDLIGQNLLSISNLAKTLNSSVLIAVNFHSDNNPNYAVNHVSGIDQIMGWSTIRGIQIGYQPDTYSNNGIRNSTWGATSFINEYELYLNAIKSTISKRLPNSVFYPPTLSNVNNVDFISAIQVIQNNSLYSNLFASNSHYAQPIEISVTSSILDTLLQLFQLNAMSVTAIQIRASVILHSSSIAAALQLYNRLIANYSELIEINQNVNNNDLIENSNVYFYSLTNSNNYSSITALNFDTQNQLVQLNLSPLLSGFTEGDPAIVNLLTINANNPSIQSIISITPTNGQYSFNLLTQSVAVILVSPSAVPEFISISKVPILYNTTTTIEINIDWSSALSSVVMIVSLSSNLTSETVAQQSITIDNQFNTKIHNQYLVVDLDIFPTTSLITGQYYILNAWTVDSVIYHSNPQPYAKRAAGSSILVHVSHIDDSTSTTEATSHLDVSVSSGSNINVPSSPSPTPINIVSSLAVNGILTSVQFSRLSPFSAADLLQLTSDLAVSLNAQSSTQILGLVQNFNLGTAQVTATFTIIPYLSNPLTPNYQVITSDQILAELYLICSERMDIASTSPLIQFNCNSIPTVSNSLVTMKQCLKGDIRLSGSCTEDLVPVSSSNDSFIGGVSKLIAIVIVVSAAIGLLVMLLLSYVLIIPRHRASLFKILGITTTKTNKQQSEDKDKSKQIIETPTTVATPSIEFSSGFPPEIAELNASKLSYQSTENNSRAATGSFTESSFRRVSVMSTKTNYIIPRSQRTSFAIAQVRKAASMRHLHSHWRKPGSDRVSFHFNTLKLEEMDTGSVEKFNSNSAKAGDNHNSTNSSRDNSRRSSMVNVNIDTSNPNSAQNTVNSSRPSFNFGPPLAPSDSKNEDQVSQPTHSQRKQVKSTGDIDNSDSNKTSNILSSTSGTESSLYETFRRLSARRDSNLSEGSVFESDEFHIPENANSVFKVNNNSSNTGSGTTSNIPTKDTLEGKKHDEQSSISNLSIKSQRRKSNILQQHRPGSRRNSIRRSSVIAIPIREESDMLSPDIQVSPQPEDNLLGSRHNKN